MTIEQLQKELQIQIDAINTKLRLDKINTQNEGVQFIPKGINFQLMLLMKGTISRIATAVSYTANVNDIYIGVTSTASARTVTLPPAAGFQPGKIYIVKDESGAAGTNNITIDANASETIDGATTLVISTNYGVSRIITNGVNWFTI